MPEYLRGTPEDDVDPEADSSGPIPLFDLCCITIHLTFDPEADSSGLAPRFDLCCIITHLTLTQRQTPVDQFQ